MNTVRVDSRKISTLLTAHPQLAEEIRGALIRPFRLADCERVFVTGLQLVPENKLPPLGRIGTEETLAEGTRTPAWHHNQTVSWNGPIVPAEVVRYFKEHPMRAGERETMQMALRDYVYMRPLKHYSDGNTVEKPHPLKALGGALSENPLHPFKELSRPDYGALWRRELNVTPQMIKLLNETPELQSYLKRLGALSQAVERERLLPDWQRTGYDAHARCEVAIPGQSAFKFILTPTYEDDGFKLILKDSLNKGGSTGDGELVIGKICCRGLL